MALTPEQQENLDLQTQIINVQQQNQLVLQAKQAKIEAVRLAKETLIENSRSKPVDSRDISAQDIISFAETLVNYIEN